MIRLTGLIEEGPDIDRPRPIMLLLERSAFRPFLGAMTLSAIGDGIAVAALTLYVESIAGTGAAVGALLLTQTLPRMLGPLAGSIADRTNTLRLMIGCDIGQAAIYAAIALLLPALGPLLGLTFAAAILQSGTSASRGALLPAIVGPERLLPANVLLGAGFNTQVAVGPLVGGLLFAAGGAGLALGVNAATFLLSAILLSFVGVVRPIAEFTGGVLADVREALSFAARNPALRTLLISLGLAIGFLSIDNVALVFLIRDSLEGGPGAYGAVLASFGVGMLLGSLAMLAMRPRSPVALFIVALLLTGAGTLLTGLAPAILAAAAFQALAGIGNSFDNAATDTLIQRLVPAPMLGRVFGLYAASAYAAAGLSAAIGGPLLDATSPRFVFIAGGIGGLGVIAYAAPRLLRLGSAVGGGSA